MSTLIELGTGVVLGFTIAAEVGPMSLLVIRRTIAHGHLYGMVSGLGIAMADATYAGIAAFGLTAITSLLVSGRVALGLIGGAIIVLLGIRTMRSKPVEAAPDSERPGLLGGYASMYALTMTNPMTILSFAAIFAGFGFAVGLSLLDAAVLTLGVWIGSSLWWVLLTAVLAWLRDRISLRVLAWVNRVAGAALVLFGIVAIYVATR